MCKISVVVPVYNVILYLEDCLKSLSVQTFDDYEVILIDDGSTDGSEFLCDNWGGRDGRFKVAHFNNAGLSVARNRGIQLAKGKYLAFVDSDDYVSSTYLQKLYESIINNNADISMCGFYAIFKEGQTNDSESRIFERKYEKDEFLEMVYTFPGFYNPAWNKLYRKELFDDLAYTEDVMNEDSYIIRDIIMKCNFIYTFPEPLYFYRRRKGSLMNGDIKKLLDGELNWISKDIIYLKGYSSKIQFLAYKLYCNKIIESYNELNKNDKVIYKKKFQEYGSVVIKSDYFNVFKKIKFICAYVQLDLFTLIYNIIKIFRKKRNYL